MIDQFIIFTTTGLVLYSKEFCEIVGNPINDLIQNVLLSQHHDKKEHSVDSYALRWTSSNDLGVFFVVVYQRILQLIYVDDLLQRVKNAFISMYSTEFPLENYKTFDFEETFMNILDEVESTSKKNKKSKLITIQSTLSSSLKSDSQSDSKPDDSDAFQNEEDFSSLLIGKSVHKKSMDDTKKEKVKAKKQTKKTTKFGISEDDKINVDELDRTKGSANKKEEEENIEVIQNFNESEIDKEEDTKIDSNIAKKTTNSIFGNIFKRITGDYQLTEEDVSKDLDTLRKKLIDKNVATEIATQITDSVKQKLIGQKIGSFSKISTIVTEALQDSVSRILSPKTNFDLLYDIKKTREQGKVYSIVFCGVNGVGKSTSLSKIAYHLKSKGYKLMIAACDTFRSGAVEQLRTHVKRLDIELFERGYSKDPADVCHLALKYAEENDIDVVLIDTAGRMQNNERLMRSLVKLVNQNNPNFILFVGEALVGNDGVDQLVEFNRALRDLSDIDNPRLVDGILLTKFDTIDDKVGAALSMVYTTNCPIVYVGTGQKYTNLKKLNVPDVVNSLLS